MNSTDNDPRPANGTDSDPGPAFHAITSKEDDEPEIVCHIPHRSRREHRTFNTFTGGTCYTVHQGVGLLLAGVIDSEASSLFSQKQSELEEEDVSPPRSVAIFEGLAVVAVVHDRGEAGMHAVHFDADGMPTVQPIGPAGFIRFPETKPQHERHDPAPSLNGQHRTVNSCLLSRTFYVQSSGLSPTVHEGLGLTLDMVIASETRAMAKPGERCGDGEPFDLAIFDDSNRLLAVIHCPDDLSGTFELTRFDRGRS